MATKKRARVTDAEIVRAVMSWVRPSMLKERMSYDWHVAQGYRQQRAQERLWKIAVRAFEERR